MPSSLIDSVTEEFLAEDRELLARTKFPIVTVSASFRDVVEDEHHYEDHLNHPDVTLSRAHYSMALGVAVTAWGGDSPKPETAWVVDPTNYVTKKDWRKVSMSTTIGMLLARNSLLGWVKQNVLDRFGRQKFPLTAELAPPLLHLCQDIERPIISLHVVTGNLLAEAGKKVVQVITDPHVRFDYLKHAELPNMVFCVFDEKTRFDFLEMATSLGKTVDPARVIVSGPPIDPRIFAAQEKKRPDSWRRRPLRLLLTTGGLGTNKDELRAILKQLLPELRRRRPALAITYYASTNADHVAMVREEAALARVAVGDARDRSAPLRILAADDIVAANNLLLAYGFPWCDIVVTKPSGDMAYDAVAAGSALFFLEPWGEWEKNVQATFLHLNLARLAKPSTILTQIAEITREDTENPWLEQALEKTRRMPPEFSHGTEKILRATKFFTS